jgi:uncharacterized protein YbjT (DUF2867 family)
MAAGMPKKTRTLDQVMSMKEKAARFVRDVVGDPERAEEFEAMSPEEYAAGKHITIMQNPATGRTTILIEGETLMARPTRADLEDRIADLEDQNQALNDKLDSILDIASGDEEGEGDGDNGDDDGNGNGDDDDQD